MDFVKQQIAQIQQQLAGLSASQKMLTGTLVAVMVMTLLWWGRYAGEAELVPLLNQTLTLDDISAIKGRLTHSNITHKVVGDRIMVPADRRMEALADLGYAQLLPQDIKTGLELIEDKMTPWDDQTKTEKMWNEAKQGTLANIIRRFPNVNSATVLIDPTQKRLMGGNIEPTASIDIKMRSGHRATKELVNAAASLVAGAQATLRKSNIKVIVDGFPHVVQEDDPESFASGSSTILEMKQRYEAHHSGRLREQLAYIPGVLVTVTVDVNIKSIQEQTRAYDESKSLHKVVESENRTEENNSTDGATGDPGVGANTQLSVTGSTGGGSTNLVEETKERMQLVPAHTDIHSKTPAGKETVVAASIMVPRSYFVQIYKARNSSGKEPDDTVLQPLIDAELSVIRNQVKTLTQLNDSVVSVEPYTDFGPMFAEAIPQTASAALPFGLGDYGKEIALGALAVMSLFMVSWMVRKSTPAPVIAAAPEIRVPQHLQTGEDVAGEVGEGNAMLQGMELDEDAVQTQQMLDQVSTMVKENPEGAANLVKRWLNR